MFRYAPPGLPPGAPVVVALHGCAQTANSYADASGWLPLADRWGFGLLLPQEPNRLGNLGCFTWFESAHIARGRGEALSIKQMVDRMLAEFHADPHRVYVTGLSAGGAMAAVMLATYPDVFAAGSIVAGIPYRCATSMVNAFSCMNPGVDKTPAQWGDLVRGAFPGYTGARPKVAIWHGTSDFTVATANANESRDQWTNVLGISASPTGTSSLPGGTTQERYGNDQVRVYRVSGMGHGTPVDPGSAADQCGTAAAYFLDTICSAYYDATFFGLNTGGPTSPPTTTPPTTNPPTTSPPTTGPCVTATNYAHVVAGRAHQQLGYVYANGSNQAMGLYNVFQTNALRQTGPSYWVVGC
jgi:feruloyl esterase